MLRGDFAGKRKIVVSVKQPTSDDALPVLKLEGLEDDSAAEPVGAGHAEGT